MATIKVRGVLKGALVLCVLAAFWNGACSTSEPVQQRPGILVTPAAVSFTDTVGTGAPGPQNIAITADGAGTLTGLRAAVDYGSGPTGWLTVTLSDTTAPATLAVTLANTSLNAATYHATVVLTATSAPNSPLNVPITFDIAAAAVPSMVISPTIVTFEDTVGTSAPAAQTVAITGNGPGILTGLKATVTYVGPLGWLTATLSDTTAPATLTLRSTNSGLNAASYRATVNVTATGAPNSPQSVPVTFNLAAIPPLNGVTIVATANMGTCGGELGKLSAQLVANASPDYVFVLGADANPDSGGRVTTFQDYMRCYNPDWGQFLNKTYATLGDHEVDIDSIPPNFGSGMASGADAYFGASHVGPPGKNWQSFDLGSWHVVALNVQTPGGYKRPEQIAYHAGTNQLNWLINDLQSHPNKCTLAVWYESMWISSSHISNPNDPLHKNDYRIQDVRGVWTALYDNNADLVINGWPRIYERFAPMYYANGYQHPTTTEWAADSVRGIRQFTTGLAGDGPMNADSAVVRLPTSEYRSGGNGVLKVVLGDGVYSWEFLNTKYSHIQDSGRGTCH
jgi:hypothetical protein